MSNETSQFAQGKPQDFILFTQDGIQVTLELPKALQIHQNNHELYPSVPIIHNDSPFHIKSVNFAVELKDVIDNSSNAIASVRWWDEDTFNGVKSMIFHCKDIKPGETKKCTPNESGYTQIRWNALASSGRAVEKFTSILSLIELKYESLLSVDSEDGPIVQIG